MKILLKDKISIYSSNANLIKTLCAFAVIIHHSFYLSQNIYDPIYYLTKGQIGLGGLAVAIFFFYSGLYVTKSLVEKRNYKIFIITRCKRIFPQLWIVILLTVFILGPIFTSLCLKDYLTNIETYKYLFNCLLIPVHNLPGVFEENIYGKTVNGALWTLPIEFMCYLSLVLMSLLSNKLFKNKKLFILFSILALIISITLFSICEYQNINLLKSIFSAITFFFIGNIYYLFNSKIQLNLLFGGISLAGVAFSFISPITNYLLFLFLPYTITLLSLFIKQINTKSRFLNFSYEIYLIAFPIQQSIVAIYEGTMDVWLNALISITTIVILVIFLCLSKYLLYLLKKKTNSSS